MDRVPVDKTATIDDIIKAKIPKYESIKGPFVDEFNGMEYYIGIIDGMKVKFNIKAVEYGKTKVIE